MAVPKWRDTASLPPSGENILRCGNDAGRIRSDEQIRSFGDRNGTLGICSKGETRDAEGGGLFLNAAGIRKDQVALLRRQRKSR